MQNVKIVLKGQKYAAPRAEGLEVMNQGVLCASGDTGDGEFTLQVEEDFLM